MEETFDKMDNITTFKESLYFIKIEKVITNLYKKGAKPLYHWPELQF
ncbi:hypothetical protein [Zunongwangia mangrovi]|nr:hypothetical protein [Zunongwangia mangrovi]